MVTTTISTTAAVAATTTTTTTPNHYEMGDDAKRWSVTYTRHLKQKRKVYQDGALELRISSNKLLLYDESEKLLDSRFLNKDEVIESGGMLAFDTHLVDIGEIERNCKPLTDLNVQGRDKRSIEKTRVPGKKPNHTSSSSIENQKVVSEKTGALKKYPNVTHNITRVHKKGQLHSFGATPNAVRGNKLIRLENFGEQLNHANAAQTTVREWRALYTMQTTQKAKKYHDGILRLSFCGSFGKQVMLYDDCRKLLDSRFLKKDEMVESGGTLAFVAHLVEIGEVEEHFQPLKDLDLQGRDAKLMEKTGMQGQRSGQSSSAENRTELQQSGAPLSCPNAKENSNYGAPRSHPSTTDANLTEWNALYTTQLTQKAKKYRDGILQLSCRGSHGRQVILLSEDRSILSSKYIKSSEHVRTGQVYELPNYLVDVGETRTSQGGNLRDDASSGPFVGSKSTSSNASKLVSGGKAPGNKLLRDACQILSVLRKPTTKEHLGQGKLGMEQTDHTQSSEFILPGLQGKCPGHYSAGIEGPNGNADDSSRVDSQNSMKENPTDTGNSGSDLLQCRADQEILSLDSTKLMDNEHTEKLVSDSSSASSNVFPGLAALNISKTKLDRENIGKSTTHLEMSIEASEASVIVTCDSPQDDQIPRSNRINCGNSASVVLVDCLNEDVQLEQNLGLTNSEGKHHLDEGSIAVDASSGIPADRNISAEPSGSALQILKEVEHGNPTQVCMGNVEPDDWRLEEAFGSVSSSSFSGPPACHATNAGKDISKESKSLSEKSMDMDDIPSFDLGI